LAVDIGAAVLFATTSSTDLYVAAWSSVGIYALGAPIIHALHDNSGRGAGSFVLRVGLPPLGFWIGKTLASCGHDSLCALEGGAPLMLVGLLIPTVLDAAVFAYEDPPNTEAPSMWSQMRVVPTVGNGRAELSVGSVF
jgi:hypothetical protein